jgi:GDP-D-mannose dehydratase
MRRALITGIMGQDSTGLATRALGGTTAVVAGCPHA